MKREFLTKYFPVIALAVLLHLMIAQAASASGLFGPLQTVSKSDGGINTAIGYWYHEDTYKNGAEHVVRQNQIYSQAAYGGKDIWEIYARIGMSDLKVFDVFSSADASTTVNKNNFEENWRFFGTLGAKGFYPINKTFGVGAFVQGTYYLGNFTDDVAGISGATHFTAELKIRNFWDANFGTGFQITFPRGIRFYAGPYIYYSGSELSLTSSITGLEYGTGNVSVKNKTIIGGFTGMDIPLVKGFHLNIEGQFSERFSAGAAVSYAY
jgi:hypothetical protein